VPVIPELDDSRFRENLAFLRTHHPALHDKIANLWSEHGFELANTGGLTFKLRGVFVESRYDPEGEAVRLAAPFRGKPRAYTVYMGCGLGYHINLMENGGSTGALLVEKDLDVFRASLHVLEPSVLRSLTLFIDADVQDVQRHCMGNPRRPEIVEHGRCVRLHREYYGAVKRGIEAAIGTAIASDLTVRASRRLWVRNVLRNLSSLGDKCYGSRSLERRFRGPVVLVASGPFLEDAELRLKTLSRRVPVISLLPSLPYLLNEGITVDLVLSTDAGFWNRYRFHREAPVPLISTYSVDSWLLRNWKNEIFLFSHGLELERAFTAISESSIDIPMQGTASIVMILLARHMGFSPILLAGYDFAYRGIGDHIRGAGFEKLLVSKTSRFNPWQTVMVRRLRDEVLIRVEDSTGKMRFSSHKLLLYRNWLAQEVVQRDLLRLNSGATVENLPIADNLSLERFHPGSRQEFQRQFDGMKRITPGREMLKEGFRRMEEIVKSGFALKETGAENHLFDKSVPPQKEQYDDSDLLFLNREIERAKQRLQWD
jgi:hypothetical protein